MKSVESQTCTPEEIALKSFFLGPQAENAEFLKTEVFNILDTWIQWRRSQFPSDGFAISKDDQQDFEFQKKLEFFRAQVNSLSNRFADEIPKFSPRYIGHMFSEFSLPALLGHFVCLLHNPNNVSKESSRVGVEIEIEAIQALATMFGYSNRSVGHFTSGGTIANFESVVRAKKKWLLNLQSNAVSQANLNEASYCRNVHTEETLPLLSDYSEASLSRWMEKRFNVAYEGPMILVPTSKHYSWSKAVSYFGLGKRGLKQIPLNKWGQMDIQALRKEIDYCLNNSIPILSVNSICGSTEFGTVDPIEEIQDLLDHYKNLYGYNFWHHTDAAYGGFFATLKNCSDKLISGDFKRSLTALARTTSITVDPHKLGYVPYSSGAFLCRDPEDYFIQEVGAAYVDFQNQVDRGAYTIEGSRSAAGAVATYMTSSCIGFNEAGYGNIILRTIKTCLLLKEQIVKAQLPVQFIQTEQTNILCFAIGKSGQKMSAVNSQTQKVIKWYLNKVSKQEADIFYISKTILSDNYQTLIENFASNLTIEIDQNSLSLIRLTTMNPFLNSKHTQINFIAEFTKQLSQAITESLVVE